MHDVIVNTAVSIDSSEVIYMHVCICISISIYNYICIYTYMWRCTRGGWHCHVHRFKRRYIGSYMYIYVDVYTHIYVNVYTYTYIYSMEDARAMHDVVSDTAVSIDAREGMY